MIERNNPYVCGESKTIKRTKRLAQQISALGAAGIVLFTMSGCGKFATEELTLVEDTDTLPNDAVVFELDDGTYYADGSRNVRFKDRAFKEAFDENPDYYSLALTESLVLRKPSSLEELRLLKNLKSLTIYDCSLEDLSIISQLTGLEELTLIGCDETIDLSFLADMDLKELTISGASSLEDLSFISQLTELDSLCITNCGSCSINPNDLAKLNLTELDIALMSIEDLSFLSNMSQLEYLRISACNLKNIDALRNLHNLKDIYIDDCLVTDATALYSNTQLEVIDLRNNSVDTFDINRFPNLQEIFVGHNYALYTDDFLDYCEQHGISTDITREDVECMKEIREIVDNLELDGLTQSEKEAKIYAYVLKNMKYDKKALSDDELTGEYNIRALYYGLQGKGVCATYSAMFDAMCDVAGIESFQIYGYAKTGLFGLSGGPHAWNLVEIDGQYMLCDPTWSDSIRDGLDYKIIHIFGQEETDKYFNVSGEAVDNFGKEHIPDVYERDDSSFSPRSNEAQAGFIDNDSVEVLSIYTTEENGESITGMVMGGMMTGSVVLVDRDILGNVLYSQRKKFNDAQKKQREAGAICTNSCSLEQDTKTNVYR